MLISQLRKVSFLKDLSVPQLRRVQKIAKIHEFSAGALIFRKADAADHMFLVIAGRVKIFSYSSARRRKTFAYLGAGEFFGEMAIICDAGRTASALAVTDCRLLIIHKKDFKRLMCKDVKLCHKLLRAVSERLRRADEEIESLLFRNILGRVAKVLHDLYSSHGRQTQRGAEIIEHYTHQELADLVGTTREPLSRALAMLRHADLVDTRQGRIVILAPRKLEALAQTPAN